MLAKASTAKLPGSERQHLPWGHGSSPHGAQDYHIIVSFSFSVSEKASNCCPKRGDPLAEGIEITGETGLSARKLEGHLLNFLQIRSS